jgi:hypothetical protein
MLRPDPSSSNSNFNYEKCDTTATNTERDPQQTPLASMTSIQPSNNSTAMDTDAAREDDTSVLFSTKCRTRATEVYIASSSASVSRCAAGSTLSYPTALSR